MLKLNSKFVITILVIFFLITVSTLITGSESSGLTFGILSYILFIMNTSKITKYDYIFLGSLVVGTIIDFANIFYKNIFIMNVYSVFITALAIFVYFKKGIHHEKN
jgi:hypothetical protein